MQTITKLTTLTMLLTSLAGCAATPKGDVEPELVVDGVEWECRRKTEIGTRLGKKVCASPEKWAEVDAAEKERADETSRRIREQNAVASSQTGLGN